MVLDPDTQVQESISYFFETFSSVASACQTVKVFRREGLLFPSRLHNDTRKVIFRPLTTWTALRTLNNPRYAGAYAYGRRRWRRTAEGGKKIERRQCSDWIACLPNAHPGYITGEQYQENLRILESNGRGYEVARASPPREGSALLRGRAVCGVCGQHFRVRYRYKVRRRRLESWYVIVRAARRACPAASRSPVGPSMRRSGSSWPKG